MCLIKNLDKIYLRIIELAVILIISIVHAVFAFFINANYNETLDLFDSSPLFDFSIGNDCQNKNKVIFHRWGGRKEIETYFDIDDFSIKTETNIVDETDITKINGNFFCYTHISYKDLLYNGQIIKKGKECPSEFKKNCGRIDTLEQELCIKENEKCPLYDVGLGEQTDLDNYIFNEESNVYYNNDNYNKDDKKIIGRLILNDGQPCYNSSEKLWRQFNSIEAADTHLQCEIEVFGKYTDDRFEQKGNITYKKLYEDNLNSKCQSLVLKYLKGNEVISLYKREFFGIDKECDKKFNLNEDSFDIIWNNEKMEQTLLYVEGFIIAINTLIILILEIMLYCLSKEFRIHPNVLCGFFSIYMGMLISCIICQIVFLVRIIQNDFSNYNCSDSITNEVIKKEAEPLKRNIVYIEINLILDLFIFSANCLAMIIGLILERCCGNKSNQPEETKKDSNELLNYNANYTETPYYENQKDPTNKN